MPFSKVEALAQIDAVLHRYDEILAENPQSNIGEGTTLMKAALDRLAPPKSAYLELADKTFTDAAKRNPMHPAFHTFTQLRCVLVALRRDYEGDRLRTFQELVRSDLFSDFLEMAEYFVDEGYKEPAAIMGGGVLEEHLRQLCSKAGITLSTRPKLDTMNAELAKAGAYGKNDQKVVTAWAGIRNDAAHADHGKYTLEQVKLMLAGIRDFINRNPA